jgi:acyl carrier protein
MPDHDQLFNELVRKFRETLNLERLQNARIDYATQLIGSDLGIDSIDILELVMMLEKDYGVKIDNKEMGQRVFQTFETLVEFVAQNRIR